ncbi:MAG: hypothetical protein J7539_14850 [Niabella sp.]|nr:hypothetical protein [Niabella sp.]
MKKIVFAVIIIATTVVSHAQQLRIKNDKVQRILQYDGSAWRTQTFSSTDGQAVLDVKSDEFYILPMNSNEGLTISDFTAVAAPKQYKIKDTSFCEVGYHPKAAALRNSACPQRVVITYFVVNGQPFLRKRIQLLFDKPATVDRLEVERFVNGDEQAGGGRGEPVFIKNQWYAGLEYPAGYSRRGDGNLPASYGRYYDSVGNYSFIDLDGRDIEPHAEKGMVRLMHFPGYALKSATGYEINSKVSVMGYSENNTPVARAFMQYLTTIWKKPVSFLNYNNWFDKSAKDLSGDHFLNVYRKYKKELALYGINLEGMVPDNGWQNRKSIWEPAPAYFPGGDADLVTLSDKLKKEGTHLGLWLSLNGYTNDIKWGADNGYTAAKPNAYFKQYGHYFSLSANQYKAAILKRVPELAKKADLIYYKHDFNELCDPGEGNNHPPTDRHGHEANLDVALQILTATRKARPGIIQNLTNWVWFSPWWLQYADYLWMLAGDDGKNGNTPELSEKALFTTDRDTYIWRMFGNPEDRPLVPVSRLMTHGILQTAVKEKELPLRDWNDYVLMHYGRGTLLKELYISLEAMRPDLWASLAGILKWAKQHESQLNNTVFVGGRPDEGNAYGYIGWNNNKAVLTVRNPAADSQRLVIPFNSKTGFYGAAGVPYRARITYPYEADYPVAFTAGKTIEVMLAGYATMEFEIEKGRPQKKASPAPATIRFQTSGQKAGGTVKIKVQVPGDVKEGSEIQVIGYPQLPVLSVNDQVQEPQRSAVSQLNHFAGYAVSGMKSTKATSWKMAGYSLLPFAGKEMELVFSNVTGKFHVYIAAEQEVKGTPAKIGSLLPIQQNRRRQTLQLY